MNTIHFYSVTEHPFGVFSNFASFPIKVDGKRWPTSEHYFQAQKFKGTPQESKIRKVTTPSEAARLGRSRKFRIQKNWDAKRDNVMWTAVWAKFTQHPELEELLLSTANATLVEHTSNDHYWGDGGDGSGKNRLGKILMKVRGKLRQKH